MHVYDVCNNIDDCPYKDDEALCELRDTICPNMCKCVLFAISCSKITPITNTFSHLPYLFFHMSSANINSLNFLQSYGFLTVLNISQNYLISVIVSITSIS